MWIKRQRSVLFSHVLPIFQLVSNVNVFLFFSLVRILKDYPQRAATAACLLLMVEPDWCGPSRTPPVWYINMIYFFFNGKRSCLDPLNTKGTFIGYLTHTYTHTERERGTVRQNPFFYQMVLKIISFHLNLDAQKPVRLRLILADRFFSNWRAAASVGLQLLPIHTMGRRVEIALLSES